MLKKSEDKKMVSLKKINEKCITEMVCKICNKTKPLSQYTFTCNHYNTKCKQCCSNIQMKKYIYKKKFPITCKVCGKIKYTYYTKTIFSRSLVKSGI